MRGDHELAAKVTHGIRKKVNELCLPRGGEAVFRLIQEIKPILANLFRKVAERAFPVGSGVQAFGQPARDVRRFGAALALVEALERVVILQRAQRTNFDCVSRFALLFRLSFS